jgi:hypothetical protein
MSNVMRALLATLLFSTVPVLQAQPASESAESMQALRAAVAQDKKGTIGNLLQLSEAEARKFWMRATGAGCAPWKPPWQPTSRSATPSPSRCRPKC